MKSHKLLSSLVCKYKNMLLPAKAGIWFLICSFFQKGIVALTTPIFTRILSTAEYGEISVYYSWQDVFSIFITFGLSSTVFSRGIVKYEGKRNEYASQMLTLSACTSVVSLFLCVLFRGAVDKIVGMPFEWILTIYIYTFFNTIIEIWCQTKRVMYEYMPFVMLTVLLTLAKPCLAITLILLNPHNQSFSRIIADAMVCTVLGIPLMLQILKKGKNYYNYKIWKDSLTFVIPLIPHYLSQRILSQSDRIMIRNMIGSSFAGIYSLAYSVGMLLSVLNSALDSTLGPWVFRKLRDGQYDRIGTVSISFIKFFALCVLDFSLVAPEVVKLFASSEYYDAIYIIPAIATSSYFIFVYVQFIYFEYFIGKTNFIGITTVICAIINLILNYMGLRKFGYVAAAYTTLICYILYAMGHYFVMKRLCIKYLNAQNIYNEKNLVMISVAEIVCCIVIPNLYETQLLRWIIASLVIFSTIYYALIIFKRYGKGSQND